MRRLFTFGCSFTRYGWPTWADILGQSFDYYENWGGQGTGNYLISSRILECHSVSNITKNDTVIVMFSSVPRIDFYNGGWSQNGNVFNAHSKPYEQMWRDNNWSLVQGFYNTWIAIKQAKLFLENIGCTYKFMKAFDLSPDIDNTLDNELSIHSRLLTGCNNDSETKFFDIYNKEINSYFGDEPNMLSWIRNHPAPPYKFKKAGNQTNYVDYHPTIVHHEGWCNTFLSEYYTNKLDPVVIENNIPLADNALIGTHNFNINKNVGKFLLV